MCWRVDNNTSKRGSILMASFWTTTPLETAKRNNTMPSTTSTRVFHIGFSHTILDAPLAILEMRATTGRFWNPRKWIKSWTEYCKHQCLHQDIRSTFSSAHRNFYYLTGIVITILRITLEENYSQEGQHSWNGNLELSKWARALLWKQEDLGVWIPWTSRHVPLTQVLGDRDRWILRPSCSAILDEIAAFSPMEDSVWRQ